MIDVYYANMARLALAEMIGRCVTVQNYMLDAGMEKRWTGKIENLSRQISIMNEQIMLEIEDERNDGNRDAVE